MSALAVTCGAATSAGRVRSLNEDAFHASGRLFVVADGMGGHSAGDIASALAVETFSNSQNRLDHAGALHELIAAANDSILQNLLSHPERWGMGTTIAGAYLAGENHSLFWLIFNVGDSRVYEIRNGRIRRITSDHSEVQELLDSGEIGEDEARTHPRRNVITRALGSNPAPDVDTWTIAAEGSVEFIICSDGLTEELTDEEIGDVAARYSDSQAAAQALVDAAELAGGSDNITVIVVRANHPGPIEALEATRPRSKTVKQ